MKIDDTKFLNVESKNTAFTLIELLTVVAIIGVLTAILLPAVSGVRERAREAAKQTVYRQYHIANEMYAAEHNGFSCPANDRGEDGVDWRSFLAPYLAQTTEGKKHKSNQNEIYVDPFFEEYDPEKPWIVGVGMNNQIRRPDTMNYPNEIASSGESQGGPTLLSAVTHPGYRILIGDVTVGDARIYNESRLDTTRHSGKGMYVLFNGSVVYYDQEEAELAFNDPFELRSR